VQTTPRRRIVASLGGQGRRWKAEEQGKKGTDYFRDVHDVAGCGTTVSSDRTIKSQSGGDCVSCAARNDGSRAWQVGMLVVVSGQKLLEGSKLGRWQSRQSRRQKAGPGYKI